MYVVCLSFRCRLVQNSSLRALSPDYMFTTDFVIKILLLSLLNVFSAVNCFFYFLPNFNFLALVCFSARIVTLFNQNQT